MYVQCNPFVSNVIGGGRSLCAFHTVSVYLQPPIQLYGVEGRYATALYSAASKQGNLETVEKELVTVSVSLPVFTTMHVQRTFSQGHH